MQLTEKKLIEAIRSGLVGTNLPQDVKAEVVKEILLAAKTKELE